MSPYSSVLGIWGRFKLLFFNFEPFIICILIFENNLKLKFKDPNPDQFNEVPPISYKRSQSQYTSNNDTNKINYGRSYKIRQSQSTKTNKQTQAYTSKQLQLIYKQYQQEREKLNGVPIVNVLILIPVYLVLGMFFFSKMEDWRKLDAFYFCFTTMFTIGFGDFIPGTTLLNKNGNKKNMYISALYIFGGLILIAMVINLVSKQLKIKVKRFARKIGLSHCWKTPVYISSGINVRGGEYWFKQLQ